MDSYTLAACILTIAVLIAYLNNRFIGMQTAVAIVSASSLLSLILILIEHFNIINMQTHTAEFLLRTDFHDLLLNGLLSFLLFAGATTINTKSMRSNIAAIFTLASFGTIISTILIGFTAYYLLPFIGLKLPLIWCLLFGALISPTDPITVLTAFKQLHAPEKLYTCVSGESLFNDGVGIVIFITLLELLGSNNSITMSHVGYIFLRQSIGGLAYGAVLGWGTVKLIKNLKDHKMLLLLTIAVATGGYAFAEQLNISGPLAMVVAGLFISHEREYGKMTPEAETALVSFWEVIDELFNAVLFLLIGFELFAININRQEIIAMLVAIPAALIIRMLTTYTPLWILERVQHKKYQKLLIAWSGMRGGLAIALALSLPPGNERNIVLGMTYAIVTFSIIVQGSTIKIFLPKQHNDIAK